MNLFRIILTLLAAGISSAAAQVPSLINYQGRITADGVNFDGTGHFKFAMVSSDGTTTYWSNNGSSVGGSEPTAAVTLPVTKGLYSVLLGDAPDMMEITPEVFAHPDVRLRVWFSDGGPDGSQLLSPDQRVASVAYAMIAGTVPDGAITSEKLAVGSVTPAALGAGSISGTLSCLGADLGDASILIAGRSIQATAGAAEAGGHPYELSPVPAGTHTVKARLESGESQVVQLTIAAGEAKTAVDFDFPDLHKQWFRDADGDGFGNAAVSVTTCFQPLVPDGETGGWVLNGADCNDFDPMIFPGAAELCDGIDNDCNGLIDDMPGVCIIDGQCIPEGTMNGPCFMCIPELSTDSWSIGGDGSACNDANPCTTDTCNMDTGQCQYTPKSNGTVCGDGQACFNGTCVSF